jgi:hypothetical protein
MRRIGPVGMALTLGQIAWVVREHWQTIPADRRARLQALLRKAKGRPSNLSDAERVELRELMRGLNLTRLARRSATTAALGRRLRPPA